MQPNSSEPGPAENATRSYRLIVGSTVMVRADTSVLASLDATIREAAKTLPGTGVEVGGFLTGELHPWIRIDGFEMLEVQHLFDRSRQVSGPGLLLFRRALADRQNQVIGFFRSHTTGEPDPVEADNVVAKLFGDLLDVSDPILLLLPASAAGLEEAQLYRRADTEWVPALRFPLTPQAIVRPTAAKPPTADSQRTAPEPRRVEPAPEPRYVEPTPEPRRVETPPEPRASPPPARRRLNKKVLWAVAGGIAASAALGFFVGYSRHPTEVSAPAGLGLAVEQSDSGLVVRWNRQSPNVLQAVSGFLTIQDGDQRLQVIPLAREQLRSGVAFYIAQTSKVDVWLDVYQDESHHRSESVALITQPPELNHEVQAEAVPPVARPEPREPSNTPPVVDLPQPPARREFRVAGVRRPVKTTTATVVAPKPFAQIPVMPQTPAGFAERTDANLPAPPQVGQSLPLRLPDLPASAPSLPLPLPVPPAIRSAPQPINYVAATSVRKVRPAIPANLRAAVQGLVSVEVKVEVDSAGKVVSAAPVEASSTNQKLLAPEAVRAALLWQFEPARRDGVPVYSEAVLTFEFERPPR